ncbi:MAG TPA: complex I NDUFA9 subunit family protein [Azospirillaceae bacterium]|nr:complex I NDUFA9 subunit family protein [Azospirillaceae bacterium]
MIAGNRVITVFGGHGFIGRHLVRRLAKTGAIINVASRHPSQAAFLKPMGSVGQIVPVAVDVTNDESVAMALRGSDMVINLIGILYERGKQTFQTVHVEAAGRIARLAKAAGVERLVHISAIGADAGSPSAYARSKAAGEKAVRAGFPGATILRPSVLFGPEDKFFNKFAAMAAVSPALPLIGGGKSRFQPVYVGDVAEAIMAALADAGTEGKTFELGGPHVYTFKELMRKLLKEIHRDKWLVPVPWKIAEIMGSVLGAVPFFPPMLTRDQVELLKSDNVVSAGALTFKDLGIAPTAAEVILPTYLDRFLIGGRLAYQQQAKRS